MGVREQIMFPEIDYDKIDAIRGMDITITTTATNDEHGLALLKAFSFPFKA
jgi:large subunit ribosomal protein L5